MKTAAQIMKSKQSFKAEMDHQMPKTTSDTMWEKAEGRLSEIMEQYKEIPKGVHIHTDNYIFPAAAIYLTWYQRHPLVARRGNLPQLPLGKGMVLSGGEKGRIIPRHTPKPAPVDPPVPQTGDPLHRGKLHLQRPLPFFPALLLKIVVHPPLFCQASVRPRMFKGRRP